MNPILKYALVGAAAIITVLVVALLVADYRYQFLFARPRVSHETAMTPGTRVRAVVQPAKARALVLRVLGEAAPPSWALDRVMPYEAALLAAPDVPEGTLGVTLFVNPQRLGPIIAEAADAYSVPRKAPYVAWTPANFDTSKRGALTLGGTMAIDTQTADAVTTQWGVVRLPGPAPFEGNHLAEVSIDNRDGSLFTLLSTFANQGLIGLPMPPDSLRKTIAPVATLSLAADLDGDNALNIRLEVVCQPTAEPGHVTGVSFALAGIYGEVVKLAERNGAQLTGEKHAEEQTIFGEYRLDNVSALVGM